MLIAVSDLMPSRRLATTSGLEAVIVQLDLSTALLVACVYIPPACSNRVLLTLSNL